MVALAIKLLACCLKYTAFKSLVRHQKCLFITEVSPMRSKEDELVLFLKSPNTIKHTIHQISR